MKNSKKYSEVKSKVKQILEFTDANYNMNILEYSYAFLEGKNYPKPIIEVLHSTGAYWIWWRNQFAIADMFFFNVYTVFDWHLYTDAELLNQYKNCHIQIQAYPGRIIERIQRMQTIHTLVQQKKQIWTENIKNN